MKSVFALCILMLVGAAAADPPSYSFDLNLKDPGVVEASPAIRFVHDNSIGVYTVGKSKGKVFGLAWGGANGVKIACHAGDCSDSTITYVSPKLCERTWGHVWESESKLQWASTWYPAVNYYDFRTAAISDPCTGKNVDDWDTCRICKLRRHTVRTCKPIDPKIDEKVTYEEPKP